MRTAALLCSAAILASAVPRPAEASCYIRGDFSLSSEGPWPFSLIVDGDTACANRNFRSAGALFKRLNALELPAHGKIQLEQGGRYSYTPVPGYRGPDRFLLQICGNSRRGEPGCANLLYHVEVR